MSIRGVLFDFGGTLNSDGDHWGALFRSRLEEEFPDISREMLENAYITSERRLVREGLRTETFQETLLRQVLYQFEVLDNAPRERGEQIGLEFYEMTCRRMEEVRNLLGDLSARYRVGIVSNFYGTLDAICSEFALNPYLSVLIDSALAGVRKPDPGIWRLAIEQLGFPPEEIAVVGDSWKNDIAPGNELGCTTIWYRGLEWRPARGDEEADYIIHSLDDLRAILLGSQP